MIRAATHALAIFVVYGVAAAGTPAAVARLDAAYAPAGKLTGAARTQQACSDAAKIQKAWRGVPERAPSTAVIDDASWRGERDLLGRTLTRLVDACAAADRRVAIDLDHKQFETADQLVERVDRGVHGLIDRARPRTLPSTVKQLRTTLAATRPNRRACAQHAKLSKLMTQLTPPANVDTAAWPKAVAELQAALDELGPFACAKPPSADEEIAGALQSSREALTALVLLVPARP